MNKGCMIIQVVTLGNIKIYLCTFVKWPVWEMQLDGREDAPTPLNNLTVRWDTNMCTYLETEIPYVLKLTKLV